MWHVKFHYRPIFYTEISIRINNPSIMIKFLQDDLKTLPEGRVSQNVDVGSRHFIVLCRIFQIIFYISFTF